MRKPTQRRSARRIEPPTPSDPPASTSGWWHILTSPFSIGLIAVAAVFLVVWPFGNYVVDDEWAYLKSLQHLHESGQVRILEWNPMSLVGMLYWALPFTKVAGFSFTAARVSAFASFVLLAFSVALVLRHLGVDRKRTTMAVLAVVFNPLGLFHGVLFMTDIPTSAWATLAVFFMLKGLDGQSAQERWLLVAGSACASFGFLMRQGLIVVPIALLAYLLIFQRRRLLTADGILATVVLPVATVAGFGWWYGNIHGPTLTFVKQSKVMSDAIWNPVVSEFLTAAFKNAIYVGLFVLPLAAAGLWRRESQAGRATGTPRRASSPVVRALSTLAPAAVVIACVVMVSIQAQNGLVFPYLPNKISPYGILGPNEVIVGDRPVLWGSAVAWAITAASVLGLLALAVTFRREPSERGEPVRRGIYLVALVGLMQFLFTVVTYKTAIDRYLLMVLPTIVILLAAWRPRAPANWPGFSLVLIPFAWYGLAGTHDVHAFSRAAFEAGAELTAKGVPAHDIDGGYAFTGWCCFEEGWRDRIVRARDTDSWWVRSVMSGVSSRYVLALSQTLEARPDREAWRPWSGRPPVLGPRDVVGTRTYVTWWPYGERTLYVLRRRGE